jgi:hypothetical protein
VPDGDDDFPSNPSEFRDHDGDGVGDREDDYPMDPQRWRNGEEGATTVAPFAPVDEDGDGVLSPKTWCRT